MADPNALPSYCGSSPLPSSAPLDPRLQALLNAFPPPLPSATSETTILKQEIAALHYKVAQLEQQTASLQRQLRKANVRPYHPPSPLYTLTPEHRP